MEFTANSITKSNAEAIEQTAETKAVDTDLSGFNGGDYPKSIQELDSWPVEKEQILVDMVNTASDNHVTERFKTAFGVSFSYTTLSSRLKDRGWEKCWHKVSDPIPPDRDGSESDASNEIRKVLTLSNTPKEERARMSMSVSKNVSDEWQSFIAANCRSNGNIRALNEAALKEYMETNKDTHFLFLSE